LRVRFGRLMPATPYTRAATLAPAAGHPTGQSTALLPELGEEAGRYGELEVLSLTLPEPRLLIQALHGALRRAGPIGLAGV